MADIRKPAFVGIKYDDDGAFFELNYLPDCVKIPIEAIEQDTLDELRPETETFFIPNQWMLILMMSLEGRLGYLAGTGKFKPGP